MEDLAVRAAGLGLDGPRGPVYDGIDLAVPAGSLLVLAGPAGTGRTSLLLTLAGRMIPSRGTAEVAGLGLGRAAGRRRIQHLVTLATVAGVNDLDGALTVEEHILERLALTSPWWRLLTPSGEDVPRVLAEAEVPGQPDLSPGTLVRDLPPLGRFRLGIALALADRHRHPPRILVVDDVDALRDPAEVEAAWRLLAHLAGPVAPPADGHDALTVLASCQSSAAMPHAVRTAPHTLVKEITA